MKIKLFGWVLLCSLVLVMVVSCSSATGYSNSSSPAQESGPNQSSQAISLSPHSDDFDSGTWSPHYYEPIEGVVPGFLTIHIHNRADITLPVYTCETGIKVVHMGLYGSEDLPAGFTEISVDMAYPEGSGETKRGSFAIYWSGDTHFNLYRSDVTVFRNEDKSGFFRDLPMEDLVFDAEWACPNE